MVSEGLDELDRHIIYKLQTEARHPSSSGIAEKIDASASTVRNRIARLEEDGVIRGYHADVDYHISGLQLYTLIVCTAPIPDREEMAKAALKIAGGVEVQEVMTREENVLVSVVGRDGDDPSRIGRGLSEIGLQVANEHIIRSHHTQSYYGFDESRILGPINEFLAGSVSISGISRCFYAVVLFQLVVSGVCAAPINHFGA